MWKREDEPSPGNAAWGPPRRRAGSDWCHRSPQPTCISLYRRCFELEFSIASEFESPACQIKWFLDRIQPSHNSNSSSTYIRRPQNSTMTGRPRAASAGLLESALSRRIEAPAFPTQEFPSCHPGKSGLCAQRQNCPRTVQRRVASSATFRGALPASPQSTVLGPFQAKRHLAKLSVSQPWITS